MWLRRGMFCRGWGVKGGRFKGGGRWNASIVCVRMGCGGLCVSGVAGIGCAELEATVLCCAVLLVLFVVCWASLRVQWSWCGAEQCTGVEQWSDCSGVCSVAQSSNSSRCCCRLSIFHRS